MDARRETRLRGFDYARSGAYFVTICLSPRSPLLASVCNNVTTLTPIGGIVDSVLAEASERRRHVTIDERVVMPDHVHVIVVLGGASRHDTRARHASPLQVVVGSFKSASARLVNELRGTPGAPLWQRGFYDHVIRDEDDLHRCREYIRTNLNRWRHP